MEPVEKKKNDFGYVDALFGILIGVVVAVWYGDEQSQITAVTTLIFSVFFYASFVYLICRFTSFIPPEWMLALSVGAVIVGLWQMRTGHAGGLDNVVLALGNAIGAMLARRVLARKSSPA